MKEDQKTWVEFTQNVLRGRSTLRYGAKSNPKPGKNEIFSHRLHSITYKGIDLADQSGWILR